MNGTEIIVLIVGILSIGFVAWFFFGKKEEPSFAKASEGKADKFSIDITVKGGYKPSTVVLQKGKQTTLNFLRTDQNSCLEEVVVSDFKIKKFLPLNEKVSISINPQKSGAFPFSCGMGMFHGKIIVK